MTVGTFVQPDFQSQTGTGYKTNLDNAIAVSAIAGKWFAPHEASPPDLSVVVDKGRVYDPYQAPSLFGPGPVTVTFVAPTTNPRIDRLAIDPKTGAIVHHQGTEAAAPSAPGLPVGELPCAKVDLSVGMSAITNQEITDERTLNRLGLGNATGQDHGTLSKTAAYSVQLEDHGRLILCNTAGGPFTVTLPDPAAVGPAFVVTVKRTLSGGGNAVTVVSAGGRVIDGAASLSIGAQLDAVTFVSGAADWFVRGSERLRDGQVTQAKIAEDAVGLAKIAHATQGDLMYWGAGGAPALLGAGPAGQVLTTRGPGADPVWAAAAPRGYIDGLILANNATDPSNDIDVAPGVAADDANLGTLALASVLVKRLDAAWAVGSNQGGRDAGAKTASTWYHVWLIKRSDTGVVDALFSTSATAPAMPGSYDLKRRIGAVYTDASGNIKAFTQLGDEFSWKSKVLDVDVTDLDNVAELRTLTVPSGVKVFAHISAYGQDGASVSIYISSPDDNDEGPGAAQDVLGSLHTAAAVPIAGGPLTVRTDISGQVRTRASIAGPIDLFKVSTWGWRDHRGKNA